MSIEPYKISIEQTALDDLQKRLKRTRWTEQDGHIGWEHGTNLTYLKEFVNYWINDYNWRKEEARLNEFAWFTANINGKPVNFIHEKGKGPNPTPIILLHGWPDSVVRYTKLIPMLTDPERYGGKADESFDVVVPSYIGGFAVTPQPPGSNEVGDIAETCWQLMTRELGYNKFIAGGGDGGSPTAQIMARDHSSNIIGLHLTDIGWHASQRDQSTLSVKEKEYIRNLEYVGYAESAYVMVQGTIPQTLALALNDSPVGMASWILEKFRTWSDCDGDLEKIYTKDELITNIMLYWTRNHVKSFSYREEFVSNSIRPDTAIHVPVALAFPPKDLGGNVPPRELVSRNMKDIVHWSVLEKGGHFAAMEFPELMARDIREVFGKN